MIKKIIPQKQLFVYKKRYIEKNKGFFSVAIDFKPRK